MCCSGEDVVGFICFLLLFIHAYSLKKYTYLCKNNEVLATEKKFLLLGIHEGNLGSPDKVSIGSVYSPSPLHS